MKWIKCIRNDYGLTSSLDVDMIYEVLRFELSTHGGKITIKDKSGFNTYLVKDVINNITFFEDATAEIRDNKIDKLLKEKDLK